MEQKNYETGKKAINSAKENRRKYNQKLKKQKKIKKIQTLLAAAILILAMGAGAIVNDYIDNKIQISQGMDYIREKYKNLPDISFQPSDIGGVHLMLDGLSIARFDPGAPISKEPAIPYILQKMEEENPNITLGEKYVIVRDLADGNDNIIEKYLGKISKEERKKIEEDLLFFGHIEAIEKLGGKIDYENNNEENQKSGGHAR